MVCWWEASIGGLRGANTPCSGLSRYAMSAGPGVLVTASGTSTANTRGDQEAIPLVQAQARSTFGPLTSANVHRKDQQGPLGQWYCIQYTQCGSVNESQRLSYESSTEANPAADRHHPMLTLKSNRRAIVPVLVTVEPQ